MRLAEEEASNVQTDGKLLGIEIKADEVRLDKLDLLNPFS